MRRRSLFGAVLAAFGAPAVSVEPSDECGPLFDADEIRRVAGFEALPVVMRFDPPPIDFDAFVNRKGRRG